MMENPNNLRYAETHEWSLDDASGEVTVGITEFAQDQLGDLVYVELPEVGNRFSSGEACMLLESVKSASDIHMPVSGEISAVNNQLSDEPELINQSPFSEGWLFKFIPDNVDDLDTLLDAEAYEALLNEG